MELKNREEIVKDINKDYFLLLPSGDEIKLNLSNKDEVLQLLEKYGYEELIDYVRQKNCRVKSKKKHHQLKKWKD